MGDTEQETLELRLDTQESEESPPNTAQQQFSTTQTSCITLAASEPDTSSENYEDASRDDSHDNPEVKALNDLNSQGDPGSPRSRTDHDNPAEPSQALTSQTEQQSRPPVDLDLSKNGDKSESSDGSRIESPEPPNENSELNEMDTTFVGGASELDAAPGPRSENKDTDEKTSEAASDDESGMSSPKCGSDNEQDSDPDDNEELREAMIGGDDELESNKGPEISLPYKEPEQLSLQEFLARRRSKRSKSDQIKEDRPPSLGTSGALETEMPPSMSAGPSGEQPKRKSKLHEEILKAAARVTPHLSRSSFVAQTPVDELILKAVSMQKACATSPDAPKKPSTTVPGAQLKELKESLKEKIAEQRKRSRQERTKRILGEKFDGDPEEEEEEEADYETDEDDFDDEEAILAKAAAESGAETEGEEENANVHGIMDDEAGESEEEAEPEMIDSDSDIEELTERKKSQKKRKNVVEDSDDEAERLDEESDEAEEADEADEDLELQIQEDEDDASFMHLSQTQVPQKKTGDGGAILDLNDESRGEVDEDLVALCSGKFASQESGAKTSTSGDEDGEDCEGADELDGRESEDDEGTEAEEETNPNRKKKSERVRGGDFFEGEAELSGSDVGSDEEDEDDGMTEAEKKKFLKSLISENPGISEEELQEQVTRLHFKQLLDDDRKDIRLMKELLLADGDLHTDGPGRERSFKWTNLSNDFVGGNDNGSDDSEHEEETEEEAKWKARRLEREKQKKDEESADGSTTLNGSSGIGSSQSSHLHAQSALGCEESISKVLREANKSLKIVVPTRSVDGKPKRMMTGGFLSMNNTVLQKIAEKVKGNAKEKEGSQTTKNFVFRAVDKPEEIPKVSKRPSSDLKQPSSKRTKLENVTPLPKSSNQRSIFSKF